MTDQREWIPYGRQSIDQHDVDAVIEVLKSDWLTTGPAVSRLEKDICANVGVPFGVAVSSGTAALHCAMHAIGIHEGDEVILPPLTFAASANCVLYQGATPVFADVDADTLLLSPLAVEPLITPKTKAIIAVDYAGNPCDYKALRKLCDAHNLVLVADCAHSLGATVNGKSCAAFADIATFSFHPVKHITSGEGGMVVSARADWAEKCRRFRNHGIDSDHARRAREGTWRYSMVELGYNYRITDFQCVLAASQLQKLEFWLARRNDIAQMYDTVFGSDSRIWPIKQQHGARHAYHLYVLRLAKGYGTRERQVLFDFLRSRRIGVNVHYLPVYQHDYYIAHHHGDQVHCPNSEAAFERIISLPMYSTLTDAQVSYVIESVKDGLDAL